MVSSSAMVAGTTVIVEEKENERKREGVGLRARVDGENLRVKTRVNELENKATVVLG